MKSQPATKFETRLAKLQALANDNCNAHEADLAARRVNECKARAVLAYALHVGNPFIADDCQSALAGDMLARLRAADTYHEVMRSPARATLIALANGAQP
jgi:hypothetical protein